MSIGRWCRRPLDTIVQWNGLREPVLIVQWRRHPLPASSSQPMARAAHVCTNQSRKGSAGAVPGGCHARQARRASRSIGRARRGVLSSAETARFVDQPLRVLCARAHARCASERRVGGSNERRARLAGNRLLHREGARRPSDGRGDHADRGRAGSRRRLRQGAAVLTSEEMAAVEWLSVLINAWNRIAIASRYPVTP